MMNRPLGGLGRNGKFFISEISCLKNLKDWNKIDLFFNSATGLKNTLYNHMSSYLASNTYRL